MEKYSYSPAMTDKEYKEKEEKDDTPHDLLISPFNKSKWSLD
jgi:hypothetical protein